MSQIILGKAMYLDDIDKKWQTVENDKIQEIKNNSVDHISGFKFLEYIEHRDVVSMLETIFDKLKSGGQFTLTVPDLEWLSKQIIRFESGQILSGVYADFEGKHGIQTLLYGDKVNPIKSAYVRTSLWELLDGVGFDEIKIEQKPTQDETQILVARCKKF